MATVLQTTFLKSVSFVKFNFDTNVTKSVSMGLTPNKSALVQIMIKPDMVQRRIHTSLDPGELTD